MSISTQKKVGLVYGIFLTFWSFFSLLIFAGVVWPIHIHAQPSQHPQRPPRVYSESAGDLGRRIAELEDWRYYTADPQRERDSVRLERIEAAEAVREKIVYAFVVPVLLLMIKEVAEFVQSKVSGRPA